jgi:hypothetical protein
MQTNLRLIFILIITLASSAYARDEGPATEVRLTAMAPLFVGDPNYFNPQGPEWAIFVDELERAKSNGIQAITVDVWWGIVQRDGPGPGQINWKYYDHIFELIKSKGLKIIPILSTHACGGNPGDTVNIPLPMWVRQQLPTMGPDGADARYRSEGGNISEEVIGAWADPLPYYIPFWRAFRERYSSIANHMPQINTSMGPAGELTYPSYHQHDWDLRAGGGGEFIAHFPSRGAIQASSALAINSFHHWLKSKYGGIEELNRAWASQYTNYEQILFFTNTAELESFFASYEEFSPKGQDFFDWYHWSLMNFGQRVIDGVVNVFGADSSPFQDTAIGHKTPGIHWNFQRRLALLSAGQVVTRGAGVNGREPSHWGRFEGFGLSTLFKNFIMPIRSRHSDSKFVAIFTCAEQPNGYRHDLPGDGSTDPELCAFDLAQGFLRLADEMGPVHVGLENAMEHHLDLEHDVGRLENHARENHNVAEVSYLRLSAVARAKAFLIDSLDRLKSLNRCADLLAR